ncbi:MAG: response regulator [Verrucomicrobia bacterium]|jgi:CheY-like chemotaxis protein|nr:response regulator [Verrucomicrobiota bacterium]
MSCRVLLVEDNKVNQKVVTLMLQKLGVEAVIAERGETALEMAKEGNFNLILMDLHMPGMHGLDCAERIRGMLGDKAPPIVAITADIYNGHEDAPIHKRLNGVLTKPVNSDDLRHCLREHSGCEIG